MFMTVASIATLSIIIVFAITFNTIAISFLFKKNSKTTLKDKLVTALCFINLTQTIPYGIELTFAISNDIQQRLCVLSAFLICFATYTSIGCFVALLMERYISVVFPFRYDVITRKKWVRYLFFISPVIHGMMFSMPPLAGWGKYGPTRINATYCGYNIKFTNYSDKSFFYSVTILSFGVPVIFTLFCFGHIFIDLRRTAAAYSKRFGRTSKICRRSWKMVKEQYISSLLTTLIYFVSWIPYTVVCFLYFYQFEVSLKVECIAAYMSKSSTISSPVVFCLIEKRVRTYIKQKKKQDVELVVKCSNKSYT